jgi:ABC-2 type transport system permease protein
MEYRSNYLVTVFHLVIYIFFNVAFYQVILKNVGTIQGWNYPQLVVLMGTFMLIDSVFMTFMVANFGEFDGYVRLGELDRLLTKPMDPQFLVSCQRALFDEMASFFIGLGVVAYGCFLLSFVPSLLQLLGYAFFLFCSFVLTYAFGLMVSSLVFIFEKIDSIHEVVISFVQFSKLPDVYRGPIKITFMLFVPVAFAAFVPTGIFFGKVDIFFLLYYLGITIGFLMLSRFMWKFLLKRYKSAGG